MSGECESTIAAKFVVRARPDPQTLPRLINFLAQRGLIPGRVLARETNGMMTVLIEQAGVGDVQAGIIADKMRSSVLVEAVTLSRGGRRMKPLWE